MEYRVLSADKILKLEEMVAAHMKTGWKPQGGISTTLYDDIEDGEQVAFLQAMTKEAA